MLICWKVAALFFRTRRQMIENEHVRKATLVDMPYQAINCQANRWMPVCGLAGDLATIVCARVTGIDLILIWKRAARWLRTHCPHEQATSVSGTSRGRLCCPRTRRPLISVMGQIVLRLASRPCGYIRSESSMNSLCRRWVDWVVCDLRNYSTSLRAISTRALVGASQLARMLKWSGPSIGESCRGLRQHAFHELMHRKQLREFGGTVAMSAFCTAATEAATNDAIPGPVSLSQLFTRCRDRPQES